MIKLSVKNFSCIDCAELELGACTVLIGPQASGKSVLSKLCYFFVESLRFEPGFAPGQISFEAFKSTTAKRFFEWFPMSAWGGSQFVINFEIGGFQLRVSRTIYKGSPTENIRVWASDNVRAHFEQLGEFAKDLNRKSRPGHDVSLRLNWDFYDASRKSLAVHMKSDYVDSQLFIPAGRSFFTSVGKAVAAFEQGRVLDPLILRFGRLYAHMRDPHMYWPEKSKEAREFSEALNTIFGGKLIDEGIEEFVLTADGRKIPFTALSSGQQELLPLITVLPNMIPGERKPAKTLVYIEEPEAHLFPRSQSQLINILAAMATRPGWNLNLILTTHSPYVLAKFNNLIKAGQLARRFRNEEKKAALDAIVAPAARLMPGSLRAYAIVDRTVKRIVDSDGLIDAEYLDDVSSDIANEFSSLLELEFAP